MCRFAIWISSSRLRPTLLLNIDYTGTKGTNLDILEAPNRTISPSGIQIRIPNVQAFTFENSVGDSEANAAIGALAQALVERLFHRRTLYVFQVDR